MTTATDSPTPRLRILSERHIPPEMPAADSAAMPPDTGTLPPLKAAARVSRPLSPEFLAQMLMTTASTIGLILAARLLTLLALIGAFALAFLTIAEPTTNRLIANAVYDVLVFIPIVVLYATHG